LQWLKAGEEQLRLSLKGLCQAEELFCLLERLEILEAKEIDV